MLASLHPICTIHPHTRQRSFYPPLSPFYDFLLLHNKLSQHSVVWTIHLLCSWILWIWNSSRSQQRWFYFAPLICGWVGVTPYLQVTVSWSLFIYVSNHLCWLAENLAESVIQNNYMRHLGFLIMVIGLRTLAYWGGERGRKSDTTFHNLAKVVT